MKIVHAVKAEDICISEILQVMYRYLQEKAYESGRTVIYQEDCSDIASKIYNKIKIHEKHLLEP